MKHLTLLLLAFALLFGTTTQAEARDHRKSSHSKHHKHSHGKHHHGKHSKHRDFGPGYGHRGHDHHRHHSRPHHHKRYGGYYRSPGYYGSYYYGKRIFLPGLGFIYVR